MLWQERPTLQLDLSLPPAERFAALPADAVTHARALLGAVASQIPTSYRSIADAVRMRTLNRFHAESRALAERHGANWRDVVLANVSYDLLLASLGCSTVVLPTTDGPVVARNMDWMPEHLLANATYHLQFMRGGETVFEHAGWPASVGVVTGLSRRGFAVVVNAVSSPEGASVTGYPVLLFLRTVLEDATSFDDALQRLCTQRLAMSALLTLVGTDNTQRVIIERSPSRHALRWGEPGRPLMATNHYRKLYLPTDTLHEQCTRYNRLCELLRSFDENNKLSDERLLAYLADTEVIQEITAQHILMRPRLQQMRVFVPSRLVA